MIGQLLRGLKASAVREELRDARCSERAFHHAKNILARKLPICLHRSPRIESGDEEIKRAKASSCNPAVEIFNQARVHVDIALHTAFFVKP
ncbi:MAG: hypothetical protein JNJ45_09655 [Chthonomonas sp.]|nr:hypothetical protein [Chthonomonas sp.]